MRMREKRAIDPRRTCGRPRRPDGAGGRTRSSRSSGSASWEGAVEPVQCRRPRWRRGGRLAPRPRRHPRSAALAPGGVRGLCPLVSRRGRVLRRAKRGPPPAGPRGRGPRPPAPVSRAHRDPGPRTPPRRGPPPATRDHVPLARTGPPPRDLGPRRRLDGRHCLRGKRPGRIPGPLPRDRIGRDDLRAPREPDVRRPRVLDGGRRGLLDRGGAGLRVRVGAPRTGTARRREHRRSAGPRVLRPGRSPDRPIPGFPSTFPRKEGGRPTHKLGRDRVRRTPAEVRAAHRGTGGALRSGREPGAVRRGRRRPSLRCLLPSPWPPPRRRHDEPRSRIRGIPGPRAQGAFRSRRRARGARPPRAARGRGECPPIVRRPRSGRGRPREVAFSKGRRYERRIRRHGRGLLERQGDGGAVRGRGFAERTGAVVREGPHGLRGATRGRRRGSLADPAREARQEAGGSQQRRPRANRRPSGRRLEQPRGRRRPAAREGPDPSADRIDPAETRPDRGGNGMKRIQTKMEGLDEVLGGGIPEGSVVLVSGAPGTMKTTLTYHILHANALAGVRGLYVSLEQSRASLVDHTEGLGYRLEDTDGKLSILDLGTLRKKLTGSTAQPWMELFKLYTQGIRKSFDYRLLVLDSLDALEILAKFREPRK